MVSLLNFEILKVFILPFAWFNLLIRIRIKFLLLMVMPFNLYQWYFKAFIYFFQIKLNQSSDLSVLLLKQKNYFKSLIWFELINHSYHSLNSFMILLFTKDFLEDKGLAWYIHQQLQHSSDLKQANLTDSIVLSIRL